MGFDSLGKGISALLGFFGIGALALLVLALIPGHRAIARTKRKVHLFYVLPLSWMVLCALPVVTTFFYGTAHSKTNGFQNIMSAFSVFVLLPAHVVFLRYLFRRRPGEIQNTGAGAKSQRAGRRHHPGFSFISCGLGFACMLPWFIAVYSAMKIEGQGAGPLYFLAITHLPLLALAVVGHVAIVRAKRKIHLLYVLPLTWELIAVGSLLAVAMLEHRWPWADTSFSAFCVLCWLVPLLLHALLLRRLYRRSEESDKEDANHVPEDTARKLADPQH